jgi:hypothetical protein
MNPRSADGIDKIKVYLKLGFMERAQVIWPFYTWRPKSSFLQMPFQDIEVISAAFAGLVISKGFGK